MTNFKRLCEITAEMIDAKKVSNPMLRRLLKQIIRKQGRSFVFWGGKKGHNDHKEHSDGIRTIPYTDETYHEDVYEHTDHDDHYDHTESIHNDNGYSESSYHSDSNGHTDHNESEHNDR